jgi:hypothetical protein
LRAKSRRGGDFFVEVVDIFFAEDDAVEVFAQAVELEAVGEAVAFEVGDLEVIDGEAVLGGEYLGAEDAHAFGGEGAADFAEYAGSVGGADAEFGVVGELQLVEAPCDAVFFVEGEAELDMLGDKFRGHSDEVSSGEAIEEVVEEIRREIVVYEKFSDLIREVFRDVIFDYFVRSDAAEVFGGFVIEFVEELSFPGGQCVGTDGFNIAPCKYVKHVEFILGINFASEVFDDIKVVEVAALCKVAEALVM